MMSRVAESQHSVIESNDRPLTDWIDQPGIERGGRKCRSAIMTERDAPLFALRLVPGVEQDVSARQLHHLYFIRVHLLRLLDSRSTLPVPPVIVGIRAVDPPAFADPEVVGHDEAILVLTAHEADSDTRAACDGNGFRWLDLKRDVLGSGPAPPPVSALGLESTNDFGATEARFDIIFVGVLGIVLKVEDERLAAVLHNAGIIERATKALGWRLAERHLPPGRATILGNLGDDRVVGRVCLTRPGFGKRDERAFRCADEGRDTIGVETVFARGENSDCGNKTKHPLVLPGGAQPATISRDSRTDHLQLCHFCWLRFAVFDSTDGGKTVATDFWRVTGGLDECDALLPSCAVGRVCVFALQQSLAQSGATEIRASLAIGRRGYHVAVRG